MGRKLLKTVQTFTTFRNPLADPVGTRRGPLWSADPSLKTAVVLDWASVVVICLERGAELHMAQLMPLPLTVVFVFYSKLL